MRKRIIEPGTKFGRWTVIKQITDKKHPKGSRTPMHLCKCACGCIKAVAKNSLIGGCSLSCGCLSKEIQREIAKYKGASLYDPLYVVWSGMKQRCGNKSARSADYGLRGISICSEWKNNFLTFRNWAISNGWQKGMQLDRIDNDGNYEPSNCRFVSPFENNRNKRTNIWVTINGETQILQDWCNKLNMKRQTIYTRVKEQGMSYAQALTTPIMKKRRRRCQ